MSSRIAIPRGTSYIRKRITASPMSYLAKKYGIQSFVAPVQLTPQESVIENDLGELLEITDAHITYWSGTNAVKTNNALTASRSLILSLIDAIHKPQHRLEHTILAIMNKDVKSLVSAMRRPRVVNENQAAKDMREKVVRDRYTLKSKLRAIVLQMRDILKDKIDEVAFKQILDAPRSAIDDYLKATGVKIEEIKPEDDVVAEDGAEVEMPADAAPVPEGMYQ